MAWLPPAQSQPVSVKVEVVYFCCAADGAQVQAALSKVSGMRTVPQVFVGGQLVGGCDGKYRY